jgi:hypothetical protein
MTFPGLILGLIESITAGARPGSWAEPDRGPFGEPISAWPQYYKLRGESMNFRRHITISLILSIMAIGTFTGSISAQLAERLDLKERHETPAKLKTNKEKLTVTELTPELIDGTTYGFTAAAAVLEDMSSGTTQIIGASQDDTASVATNIGFDFWLDGVRQTQFSANANGLMKLGAVVVNNGTNGRTNNLATANDLPKIAAYWDDLCTSATGRVHYRVIGTPGNRKLIVEWQNMVTFGPTSCTDGLAIGTFQVWLFESTNPTFPGTVQFVYGALGANSALQGGYSNGIGSSATSFASITTVTDTVSYVASSNAQTNAIAAGESYLLSPNIPAAPSNNLVSGITATSLTLNWLDNSANEVGFVIYRSTDNVNFTFLTQTAANATSFKDTVLTPSTNYFYNVHAVSEGALSALTSFGATTSPAGAISCTGAGGPWSAPATWAGGVVPGGTDIATIVSGCTVTIDTAANAFGIVVQSGGILEFEAATARTLTVGGNVAIDSGGTLQSAATGTVTTHVLSLSGNLTNNGTLDFSTNADTAGAGITFSAGAANVSFGGSGATTDIRAITAAKGAQATIVDLIPTNLTVRGVNTDVAGFLTLTSGTFRIGGTFTMTNRVFATATYTIPLLGGIWLNNPNFTVAGQAGGTTCSNNGLFRMTQGVYNIGVGGADGMGGGTGASFIIEGGTINATRIDPQNVVTWNMSGGTVNISPTVGNTRSNFGSFELFSTTSIFIMSGGTFNLIQAATPATPIDWQVRSVPTITGGTLNVGTAATATNFNFRIRGTTPSIVIDNTTNNKTATFTAQTLIRGNTTINAGTTFALGTGTTGFLVAPTAEGGATRTFTNNGTITGNLTGSRLYFLGTGAGSGHIYTGAGIAGTTVAPLLSVDFDSVNGVDLSGAANNLITNRVILFTGNVTGAGNLELGVGGASTGTTQIGNTTTPTAAGIFDAPFTFNLGTGGQVASYLRTATSYTTGGEVNPLRNLTTMTVDNNVTSLNIAGGPLTVTGAMTLTNGVVNTNAANTLFHNGTATRTNGFVDGPLARSIAVGAYTFFVGEGAFSPVLVNTTAIGTASTLTVEAFNATLSGFNPATSLSRNWSLTESGDITADLSFTYDVDANDVNGNESDYRVYSRDGANVVTNHCSGGPCVTVGTNTLGPIIGVTSFSRWTGGENQIATSAPASISGHVRTANGNGIRNATVVLSGGNLTQPRVVQTGSFGIYHFDGLAVGETYIIQVIAKRYRIQDATRTIVLQDDLENLDFVSEAPFERAINRK